MNFVARQSWLVGILTLLLINHDMFGNLILSPSHDAITLNDSLYPAHRKSPYSVTTIRNILYALGGNCHL